MPGVAIIRFDNIIAVIVVLAETARWARSRSGSNRNESTEGTTGVMVQPSSESTVEGSTSDRRNHPTFQEWRLGATRATDGHCEFLVWAPGVSRVAVRLFEESERVVELAPEPHGYHQGAADSIQPNVRYTYRLDGNKERADPASRFQPEGVHGPSQVIETSAFEWNDQEWRGLELEDYIFYELHTGTYTTEGTFDAIIPRIADLKSLGVSAIELMPVAQFPGGRNWGYDGVFPFAVQSTYGGPEGLKRLVNACHCEGLAVVLDVVYNHLGPEGNYLPQFAPYFTDRYKTPWGHALNFDDAYSDEVRHFFISNALEWIADYHFDALRLDAVHAILDHSAVNFLEELAESVHEQGTASSRSASK